MFDVDDADAVRDHRARFSQSKPGKQYQQHKQRVKITQPDGSIVFAETLRLILRTLEANHFNVLHANAVPGVQLVEVQAKAAAGVALGGTSLGDAGAEAFVGSGALYVETIRLIRNADGTTDLDNVH